MKYLLTISNTYLAADEVGRGCFAGPLVVGVVNLPKKIYFYQKYIKDSKKLSTKSRNFIITHLKAKVPFSLGIVSSLEIDELGLTNATRLAIKRAILAYNMFYSDSKIDTLYLDGVFDYGFKELPFVNTIVKGDSKYFEIALAAIFAKVYRDEIMNLYSNVFSNYKFANNVGYGTKIHIESIKNFGITRIHRKIFLRKLNEKKNFNFR